MKKFKLQNSFIYVLLFSIALMLAGRYTHFLKERLYDETKYNVSAIIDSTSKVVNKHFDQNIKGLRVAADIIGQLPELNKERAINILNQSSVVNDYIRLGVIDVNGDSLTSTGETYNFAYRDFFQKAINGEETVSEILSDVFTGEYINVFAVPITASDGSIKGVLYGVSETAIVQNILGSSLTHFINADAYIIDKNGDVVIDCINFHHKDNKSILAYDFTNQDEKNELIEKLETGDTGVFVYNKQDESFTVSYTPLSYNDWFIVIEAESVIINSLTITIMHETLLIFGILSLFFAIIIARTIYQQKINRKKLEQIAFYDNVTSTYNWNYMSQYAPTLLAKNSNVKYVLVSMDVDKFKLLNDMHGYSVGNAVIKNIANCIEEIIEKDECAARYVADNFTLLLKFQDEDQLCKRMEALVEKIEIQNVEYSINVSVGFYIINDLTIDFALMNDRANLAKQMIKNTIDCKFNFYQEVMRNIIIEEKEIENDMYDALMNKEFQVYLQPKYDSRTNSVVGAEALVRWIHHDKGVISPADFIPLFERNRFILILDKYVLNETCATLAKWKKEGRKLFTISVNLSRLHLTNPNLGQELLDILNSYNVEQEYIELELTETVLMDEKSGAMEALYALKRQGFKLAIDDFGSGYSSLKLLKEIPADVLKIDKVFIDHIQRQGKERIVVSHVVSLAKDLDMDVICEGVELREQVDILRDLGCYDIQGYFYAKPMPLEEFEEKVFKK